MQLLKTTSYEKARTDTPEAGPQYFLKYKVYIADRPRFALSSSNIALIPMPVPVPVLIDRIAAFFLEEAYKEEVPGLLVGDGGVVLFLAHYYKFINPSDPVLERMSVLLESILESTRTAPLPGSLSVGYAGTAWLVDHLIQLGLLDPSYATLTSDLADIFLPGVTEDLNNNHYDLLSGFAGKYHLLSKLGRHHELYEKVRDWSGRYLLHKEDTSYISEPDQASVNLGFAHGLPGLLLFFTRHHMLPAPQLDRCLQLFRRLDKARPATAVSRFLNTTDRKDPFVPAAGYSRYAWCYGDLGILWAMTSIRHFSEAAATSSLIDSLLYACNKRSLSDAVLDYWDRFSCYDIGFCHGLSGIVHLQRRIGRLLPAEKRFTTDRYWQDLLQDNTERLLNSLDQQGYDGSGEEDIPGLLNGLSGAGLVLLTGISHDFSWDECLTFANE